MTMAKTLKLLLLLLLLLLIIQNENWPLSKKRHFKVIRQTTGNYFGNLFMFIAKCVPCALFSSIKSFNSPFWSCS